MRVKDLIEALQGYPEDMEVEVVTEFLDLSSSEGYSTWEPVSEVVMYNALGYGNAVRLS